MIRTAFLCQTDEASAGAGDDTSSKKSSESSLVAFVLKWSSQVQFLGGTHANLKGSGAIVWPVAVRTMERDMMTMCDNASRLD